MSTTSEAKVEAVEDIKQTPTERRKARCGCNKVCEVADRQEVLVDELREFRVEITELKADIHELLTLFNESKTVVGFIKGTGKLLRWLALTLAAIAAIWASVTHWRGE